MFSWWLFQSKSIDIFLISPQKHMLWYSLVLTEVLLMSTHNICFCWEIKKLLTWYPLLSRPMQRVMMKKTNPGLFNNGFKISQVVEIWSNYRTKPYVLWQPGLRKQVRPRSDAVECVVILTAHPPILHLQVVKQTSNFTESDPGMVKVVLN